MKYSYLALRLGLAIVFFWFGVDSFLHPGVWVQPWIPVWLIGIFQILTGLSLVTGVFMSFFSLAGILLLLGTVTVRDAGLVGALLAIVLWPDYGNGTR